MFKHLHIDKPLAIIDCETTGVDPATCRIIELFVRRLFPGDPEPLDITWRIDPGCQIPPGASAIHGIRDEDVADCTMFDTVRWPLAALLEGCDLLGYNLLGYDLPLLQAEFSRAGWPLDLAGRRLLDPLPLWQGMADPPGPHRLMDAVAVWTGEEHDGAHKARSDALAAAEVLDAMLGAHPELPRTVPELAELCTVRSAEQQARYEARNRPWRPAPEPEPVPAAEPGTLPLGPPGGPPGTLPDGGLSREALDAWRRYRKEPKRGD